MKSMKLTALTALIPFFVAGYSSAQAALDPQGAQKSYVLCKNQKVVRTLRIEQNEQEKICVAYYTKGGIDREVARAQMMMSCLKVVDNIKGNLEKADWKCKEIKSASFSSADEE